MDLSTRLRTQFELFAGQTHMSVLAAAVNRAMGIVVRKLAGKPTNFIRRSMSLALVKQVLQTQS